MANKKKAKKRVSKASAKGAKKEKSGKFAVIKSGGKQYLVKEGESVKIERIKGAEGGKKFSLGNVLLLAEKENEVKIGNPFVDGAEVEAMVEEEGRAKKIIVTKFKSKTRQFKKMGHRQFFSKVKILKIK